MNKEELTKALEYTEKKHRHDTVNTFDTDISLMCADVLRVLKNCIEIPDNATNGDVIKAVFPNMDFYDPKFPSVKITISDENGHCFGNLDSGWWNAPYKRETE